jgi:uncharacterized protein YyaL (SSP411 family)
MRRVVDDAFAPSMVTVFRPDDAPEKIAELAPYVRDQRSLGGRATAYLCRNFACERPTTDLDALRRALGGAPGRP